MGDLKSAKTLGGIGAIIMLVGGFIFPLLSIVGLILVAVAVKYISETFKDNSIFSNFIMYIVMQIIAIIALVAVFFLAFNGFAFNAATGGGVTDFESFMDGIEGTIIFCILALVIAYILYIIAALFLKKSFDSIGEYTKVNMFKTTALVNLIGAFLMIILFGALIIFIAEILMIVAFFSLPDHPPGVGAPPGAQGAPGQPAYPQQPQQPGRVCPNCGRPIPMDAQVCPYCGKDFRQQ